MVFGISLPAEPPTSLQVRSPHAQSRAAPAARGAGDPQLLREHSHKARRRCTVPSVTRPKRPHCEGEAALIQMHFSDNTEEVVAKAARLTKQAASEGAEIICLPELATNVYFPFRRRTQCWCCRRR